MSAYDNGILVPQLFDRWNPPYNDPSDTIGPIPLSLLSPMSTNTSVSPIAKQVNIADAHSVLGDSSIGYEALNTLRLQKQQCSEQNAQCSTRASPRKSLIEVTDVLAAAYRIKSKKDGSQFSPMHVTEFEEGIDGEQSASDSDSDAKEVARLPRTSDKVIVYQKNNEVVGSNNVLNQFRSPTGFVALGDQDLPSSPTRGGRSSASSLSDAFHHGARIYSPSRASPSSPGATKAVSRAQKYLCTVCHKPFMCPSKVKRHMRIHTGERPFVCYCGRNFTQRCSLKSHSKIHAKEHYENGTVDDVTEINGFPIQDLLTSPTPAATLPSNSPRVPHLSDSSTATFTTYDTTTSHRNIFSTPSPKKNVLFGNRDEYPCVPAKQHRYSEPELLIEPFTKYTSVKGKQRQRSRSAVFFPTSYL